MNDGRLSCLNGNRCSCDKDNNVQLYEMSWIYVAILIQIIFSIKLMR